MVYNIHRINYIIFRYNGMPTGCSDDIFPWDNENKHLFGTDI